MVTKCTTCSMKNGAMADGTCDSVPFGKDPFSQCGMTGTPAAGGCGATMGQCACEDQQKDGDETDVDCGGGKCPGCGGGQHCSTTTDCAVEVPGESPVCTTNGTCCESFCNQACETCDTTGHCAPVPAGATDPNAFCHAMQACGPGNSGCLGVAGAACNPQLQRRGLPVRVVPDGEEDVQPRRRRQGRATRAPTARPAPARATSACSGGRSVERGMLLASSGGILLETIAKRAGLGATRWELVDVHARVAAPPTGRRLADLAAVVHRLERGLRLM